MGYNAANETMAERRSSYFFSSRELYEEAKDHLYDKMHSDYYDSNKIYFEDSYGEEYVISIMDECSDPEKVASICREHRGVYKPRW